MEKVPIRERQSISEVSNRAEGEEQMKGRLLGELEEEKEAKTEEYGCCEEKECRNNVGSPYKSLFVTHCILA